ncbi:TPA: alcohol dehydrogenase catalytic domain-containing protein [Candidatus Galligastranaerophilus intestinavium]|uniref:Alcohol dehydrogenase catalytic domain-containing protein n=1 Tax=Candidatus Galligastranaerophilus intestinavium TaxID=2840836 RepID=A0A9D1JWX4_9BACT|nr:alcohol dehydrogenase catalytic domain-containing protein [Candidatus Galligastranaerophilus intestinavium]
MKSAKLLNSKVEIIQIDKPTLNTKGAIIKVFGCGLCGSDIVKIKHATKENEDKVVLGHEVVGQIVEIDSNTNFKVGDIVALGHHYPCFNCEFCRIGAYSMCETFKKSNISPCGFSEFIKVDENHLKYTVYKVPKNLEYQEIAYLEPLACVIRAIRRAGYKLDSDNSKSNSLVIGLGSIGLITAEALKAFGVKAFGYDINKNRTDFAKKYGVEYKKDEYDCIFMTSGSSKAINTALEHVRNGGKIIVFSSVENEAGYKNNDIYYRELSIIASYSPSVEDYKISYDFLCNKKANVKDTSTIYTLDNLPLAIEDSICGRVFKAYIKV